jgi:hypothetical protein
LFCEGIIIADQILPPIPEEVPPPEQVPSPPSVGRPREGTPPAHEGSGGEVHSAVPPEYINNAFMRQMAESLRRIVTAVPPSTAQQPPIDRLRKYGVEDFRGSQEDNPETAEHWFNNTERVFGRLQCTPQDRLDCAVSLLKDDAYSWWETRVGTALPEQVTWEFFVDEFRKKYIGAHYIDTMRKRFENLKQGKLSVSEYEREFVRLAKYAPGLVPTEEDRCKRFYDGLNADIRIHLVYVPMKELTAVVAAAMNAESIMIEQRERRERGKQKRSTGQASFITGSSGSKKFRGAYSGGRGQTHSTGPRPRPQGSGRSQMSRASSAASVGGISDRLYNFPL